MKKTRIVLYTILLLATFLRLYKLGENPPSLDWDEASLGYNAYSILKTGKDEYGNFLPFSIRSFNDYKPPLYVYATVPSVAIFGLNEFAVRLPSALAGVLTVFLIYFLTKELFSNSKKSLGQESEIVALTATFLISISPWHLQFSRVAFEANIALFFFVLGTFFLLKALKRGKLLFFTFSAISFVGTMYFYHSSRVIVPVFLLTILIILRKKIFSYKKQVLTAFSMSAIILIPILLTLLRGSAQARFSTVSVFTNLGIYTKEQEFTERQSVYREEDLENNSVFSFFHHPWITTLKIITSGYLDHFDLRFLFLEGDNIGRHSAVGMGLLYWWELPFLLGGLYYLSRKKPQANKIIFPWLLTAPIAAALTTHTPHAVRSLIMLPPLLIITAFGLIHLIKLLNNYHRFVIVIIGVIAVINIYYYLNLYYIHTPIERSQDWVYGYKQLVEKVEKLEQYFDEVIVTTDLDQPYIYFLFYKKTNPTEYQKVAEQGSSGFDKYIFRKIEFERDKNVPNALIVGVPKEIPDDAPIIDKIDFLNGETAFLLVKT